MHLTTRRRSPARHRLRALLAAPALAVGLVVAAAAPASAHDELVATVPADGASVPAPRDVVLRFSEPLLPEFNQVVLTGPDGRDVAADVEVDGATVTGRLPTDLVAGAYRVAWRASSGDGHPVSGRFGFTVVAAPTPTATTPATPTTPTTSTEARQGVVPQVAPSPTPSPAGTEPAGIQPGSRSAQVLAVAGALTLLTSLVLLWRRRQGRGPGQPRG